jgi:hypothetical protein
MLELPGAFVVVSGSHFGTQSLVVAVCAHYRSRNQLAEDGKEGEANFV